MKRMFAFAVLLCLMLCGCITETADPAAPDTEPTANSTVAPTQTTPTTIPQSPASPESETVTVYLLEKSAIYDSGFTEYEYDEQHNIVSYRVFTIENELMYTSRFEDLDENGMATTFRTVWNDGAYGDTYTLTYFADGKLKEEQLVDFNYTGYQYDYNEKGDVTEKREYYDGILQSTVYYVYEDGALTAVYKETPHGDRLFDGRAENGLITQIDHYQDGMEYRYLYEYDENGNLVSSDMMLEGEEIPCETYSYKAVEVDASRAAYLTAQQQYLVSVVK